MKLAKKMVMWAEMKKHWMVSVGRINERDQQVAPFHEIQFGGVRGWRRLEVWTHITDGWWWWVVLVTGKFGMNEWRCCGKRLYPIFAHSFSTLCCYLEPAVALDGPSSCLGHTAAVDGTNWQCWLVVLVHGDRWRYQLMALVIWSRNSSTVQRCRCMVPVSDTIRKLQCTVLGCVTSGVW